MATASTSASTSVIDQVVAMCAAGQLEQAKESVLAALELHPHDGRLYELLGAIQLKLGAAAEAIVSVREATILDPSNPRMANLLGLCHMFAGQPDAAAESFRNATEIDSNYAQGHVNLGWMRFAKSDIADMNRCFRKWLTLTLSSRSAATRRSHGRLDLSRVTLCCIDCAYQDLAIDAMKRTIAKCNFAQSLFFTDKDCVLDDVRVVKIATISSSRAYSNFVIHELPAHIETEYVLIIQYDGFVLHPEAWDDAFLEYDYIGAKILLQNGYIVGNGGFSLRSRRLLDAMQDETIRRFDASDDWSEDLAICVIYRTLLENKYGIRFGPGELADRFAAESTAPTAANFGFHNLIHLVRMEEHGFQDVDPPGTNRVTFSVTATSPIGEFRASAGITLGGSTAFDRKVAAAVRIGPPAVG